MATYDPAHHDWRDETGNLIDEEDRGLRYDLPRLSRRGVLGLFGAIGAATLAGCATASTTSNGTSGTGTSSTSTSAASSSAATTAATATTAASVSASADSATLYEAPDETAGPYPADGQSGMGSTSVDVLDDSGIVRSDIRSSFGTSTKTAEGVPLTIKLTLKDADTSQALAGAAVYLWHCDRDGNYSMYSQGVTGENYLRGVQVTDGTGTVTFTSIFPACYSGRWPHIHFEVYGSQADATSKGKIVKTSQIALPQAACDAVYATTGYTKSVTNLKQVTLATDNVFGNDAGVHQIPTMSGDVASGYTAAITFGI